MTTKQTKSIDENIIHITGDVNNITGDVNNINITGSNIHITGYVGDISGDVNNINITGDVNNIYGNVDGELHYIGGKNFGRLVLIRSKKSTDVDEDLCDIA